MSNTTILVQNICLRAKDDHQGTVHSLSKVVFLLPEVCFLQGVLHSSSLPDYIEDKKSGGQQTDCLKKWLCSDTTVIIGLAETDKQMLKTVNIVKANRY